MRNIGYSFDSSGKFKLYKNLDYSYNSTLFSSISQFNGQPLLYMEGSNVHDFSQTKTTSNKNQLSYPVRDFNAGIMIPFDTTGYLINGLDSHLMSDSLKFSLLMKNKQQEYDISPSQKNMTFPFADSIYSIGYMRDYHAQPIAVVFAKNHFYAVRISGNQMTLLDSFYFDLTQFEPDSIKRIPKVYLSSRFLSLKVSNVGDRIAFLTVTNFPTLGSHVTYSYYTGLFILEFDKLNLKFKKINQIFENKVSLFDQQKNYFYPFNSQFSANDSFLYFVGSTFDKITHYANSSKLYQYDIHKQTMKLIVDISNDNFRTHFTSNSNLGMNHLGEIFFFSRSGLYDQSNKYYLSKIKYPGKAYPQCQLVLKAENPRDNFYPQDIFPSQIMSYLRYKIHINYQCDAKVKIENRTLKDIGINQFTTLFKTRTVVQMNTDQMNLLF